MGKFRGVRPGKGNSIELRWQVKGKPRRSYTIFKSPTEKNQADAARFRDRLIEQDRLGEYEFQSDPANPTFEEVCKDYLSHATKELKRSTVVNYQRMLERHWSELGSMHIRDIRFPHLRAIDTSIIWASQKTRRNSFSAIKQIFSFAMDQDIIDVNYALKLRAGKWQKPEIDAFSIEEKSKILDKLTGKYRVFYLLMFENGMRTGEIQALKITDIKTDGILRVERSMYEGQTSATKTHQARNVRLSNASVQALKIYKEALLNDKAIFKNKERWLFLNQYHNPYATETHLTNVFKKACELAKVRYRRPYYCRHSFATHALAKGVNPGFVAHQMGDRMETVLRNYATWINTERDLIEMEKFDRED